MIKVSTTGMAVSLKTDLRFPISGQWGHGDRIIQRTDLSIRKKYEILVDIDIYSYSKTLIFLEVTGFFMLYLNYHLRVWRLPDGSVFYRGTAE